MSASGFQDNIVCGNIDENELQKFLSKEFWPIGLQRVSIDYIKRIPLRFFIVDDSGSMNTNDGHRLLVQGNTTRIVPCSRWRELVESLKFHASLSHASSATTEFRFLNNHAQLITGLPGDTGTKISNIISTLESISPSGGTPLCRHIHAIVDQVRLLEPQLRSNGQKVVLTIFTDGESSDGSMADALRPFQHLPVWIVIRLCTDEEKISEYWNKIDDELELDMDVLDDLRGEAEEVYEHNSWLTYSEQLHQLREFGITMKEFDLLDERTLSSDQMTRICSLLFGNGSGTDIPHPDIDWKSFEAFLVGALKKAPRVYSPLRNSMQPWINMTELRRTYNPKTCTSCLIS